MSNRLTALCASLAIVGSVGVATQAIAAEPTHGDNCFLSRDWDGWKSPDPTSIYLRVGVRQIYLVKLSAPSDQLQWSDTHLVNRVRGSEWICNPLDLDLDVADNHGTFREPLFVKSITRLTPEEIAAIPKRDLP